jgi:hypothetical protein
MVITKTTSRNFASKAAKIGKSAFAGQYVIITREVATVGSSTEEENLEDLGCNADLYIFILDQDIMQD